MEDWKSMLGGGPVQCCTVLSVSLGTTRHLNMAFNLHNLSWRQMIRLAGGMSFTVRHVQRPVRASWIIAVVCCCSARPKLLKPGRSARVRVQQPMMPLELKSSMLPLNFISPGISSADSLNGSSRHTPAAPDDHTCKGRLA